MAVEKNCLVIFSHTILYVFEESDLLCNENVFTVETLCRSANNTRATMLFAITTHKSLYHHHQWLLPPLT